VPSPHRDRLRRGWLNCSAAFSIAELSSLASTLPTHFGLGGGTADGGDCGFFIMAQYQPGDQGRTRDRALRATCRAR
jgi:hypothetical protein